VCKDWDIAGPVLKMRTRTHRAVASPVLNLGVPHTRRLEWTKYYDTDVLLDGAHNPHAAKALRSYLDEAFGGAPVRYALKP